MNNVPPLAVAIDSKRGRAMVLMVVSSVVISFGGLIMRSMEAALPWQINFYRSVALFGFVSVLILLRFRRESFSVIGNIGALGCLAGVFLGCAGMAFMQALARTTGCQRVVHPRRDSVFRRIVRAHFVERKNSRAQPW